MNLDTVKSHFKSYNCCVIIPTYNNQNTLKRVLDSVLNFTDSIIVVNDGSTQETSDILSKYPQIDHIKKPKNTGKGTALKTGFKHAVDQGFDYAITLDSDGQHFAKDIPVFIEALAAAENKNLLLIGDRNMNEANVFAASAKGNRISSYWVRAVTGLDLRDSQSGFRLYPVKAMAAFRYLKSTKKFEFEVEAIVKSHWAGISIGHVPIHVLYDENERVSHFRPFMDIARIVVLIIWFLLVRLFYITPRDFFRKLKKKGLKRFLIEDFLQHGDSPKKKAFSIALGVFIGLSPLWGFHTVIVLFLAVVFKLNKVIAFAFSNISLPPLIPFVLLISLQTGNWILGKRTAYSLQDFTTQLDLLDHLETYIIGSITLSLLAAISCGLLGYIVLSFFNQKKENVYG
ncbi:DUF2062 domain-containing protein [Bizionia saleffrena]|uniref:DUF2062 domain-containing protein n=1 Tax=Bizionia saleffrena TaxID=291189 RepID=A0A8H2LCF6_9FLAO|nr:DUF2062 domain-containing protein [Bizionia saleffrena]TYB74104.1 DUF2062 domain-containing protein [Bizionia saleffrena]